MTWKIILSDWYGVWQKGKIQGWLHSFQTETDTRRVERWLTKIEKTVEVPEFIWGQLSSRCLLDIQMEMLTKKLYVKLEFIGEVLAGNKNDQFIDGN